MAFIEDDAPPLVACEAFHGLGFLEGAVGCEHGVCVLGKNTGEGRVHDDGTETTEVDEGIPPLSYCAYDGDDEGGRGVSTHGGDGLHCLAEAHIIRKDATFAFGGVVELTVQHPLHAFVLIVAIQASFDVLMGFGTSFLQGFGVGDFVHSSLCDVDVDDVERRLEGTKALMLCCCHHCGCSTELLIYRCHDDTSACFAMKEEIVVGHSK